MPGSGIAAGVLGAVSFGIGDFTGALATRRASAALVVAGAQIIGFVGLAAFGLLVRPELPGVEAVAFGLAAGVAGAVGLGSLYRGMAIGAMGLVSSLAGAGSLLLPLVVSLVGGAGLSGFQLAGIIAAAAAAGTAGGTSGSAMGTRPLLMAAVASLGFGSWYVFLDLAAESGDPLWALIISRGAGTLCAGGVTLWRAGGLPREVPGRLLLVAGVADVGGNALYVVARDSMPVGVAAALIGVYPVITTILARLVLHERLSRGALLAVGLALLGIVLISLGGQ